jgi:hypothetical protein
MTKKLSILVSQDCETKSGRYQVSPREISVEFSNDESVGVIIGTLVDQFFDVLEVQRKYRQSPYKLNKPIKLQVAFESVELSCGERFTDTFEQGVRISGEKGIKKFAEFMVDLIAAVVKSKSGKRVNVKDILDEGYVRVTPRHVCDSTMGEFMSVAL